MHLSVKTDSDSEEKKKIASSCEIMFLKVLEQIAVERLTASGSERREILLNEQKETRETIKCLREYHAEICNVEPGNSITITLQFFSAYDLKAFLNDLSKLEDCVMKDLKQLPECQKYDFTDIYIEVKVDEELCEEVQANLRESK